MIYHFNIFYQIHQEKEHRVALMHRKTFFITLKTSEPQEKLSYLLLQNCVDVVLAHNCAVDVIDLLD